MNLPRCFALCTLLLTSAIPVLRAQAPDLRPFMGREDVWPRSVTLKSGVAAGKGQAAIPAGAVVKVVGVEGTLIGVEYQGALTMVPVGQTDFVALAAAALEKNPTPPPRKVAPQAPAAAPARPQAMTPPNSAEPHGLGRLEQELMFGNGSKIPPGKVNLASRNFILLQFGGGNRWGAAMKQLAEAVVSAHKRGANFEVVQVPIPGMSVADAGALLRENGGLWPTIDPTDQRLLTALWSTFGHAGSFALALVDRSGAIVAKTVPKEGSVDEFHLVIAAIGKIP